MPVGIYDAGKLADFRRNHAQLGFRQAEYVNLYVQQVIAAELGDDPAGQHIEILKSFEDSSERTGVSFSDDAKPPYGEFLGSHGTDSSYINLGSGRHRTPAFTESRAGNACAVMYEWVHDCAQYA
jgi:hypothetical protein